MNITGKQFEEYWEAKGKYSRIKNPSRFKSNLINKIETLQDTYSLDDYVCSLRTGKEKTRKIVVEFYNYLISKGAKIESDLFKKQFEDNPVARQLELAKYLHKPRKMKEIEEEFDTYDRTVRDDLHQLEEGIKVLGSTIKIKKEKQKGTYYYKSTLHPIFLPLNLTEVYALTVYLKRIINHTDPNAQMIMNIAERIKTQLSDYAYDKLFPGYERPDIENRYLNDEQLANQREGIYMYLMKSGQKCRFIWKEKEYTGRIRFENNQYKIVLENGEVLDAKIGEVDFIIDTLEYE